jgi:UDP-N-acetylmuramoyl-tripeptide--D-alanyl-D-alanine ligase
VGKAHLQGFGSLEGVCKAKGELYDYLAETHGVIFCNAEDPLLCKMIYARKVERLVPYNTTKSKATILPNSDTQPFLQLTVKGFPEISTHLVGNYNTDNVLAALAIGGTFGVSPHDAVAAINKYIPSNNRSQLLQTAQHTVIIDAYNANPSSMAAAINNFAQLPYPNKCTILGDMLELGASSAAEHAQVISLVKQKSFTSVFLVGEHFIQANAGHVFQSFENVEALKNYLHQHPIAPQTTVLLKASRGIGLETLIPEL